jgi:ferredoxin
MIITAQKAIADIKESVKDAASVFLVGCGECATTCGTGGEAAVAALRKALEAEGKRVTGACIPKAPCVAAQIKSELARNMAQLREADAVIVLACGLGVQAVKDNDRTGKRVVPANDSLCGAVVDGQGNFLEKCSLCGECVLEVTQGICPVTLCPKGLLNGPCGGVNKGKSEVHAERDCAWVTIFNEAHKHNGLRKLSEIRRPRNYRKTAKPQSVKAAR